MYRPRTLIKTSTFLMGSSMVLVMGWFGAQSLWYRQHHRYDQPRTGAYYGLGSAWRRCLGISKPPGGGLSRRRTITVTVLAMSQKIFCVAAFSISELVAEWAAMSISGLQSG